MVKFPDLFSCAEGHQAMVLSYLERYGSQLQWEILRKNLSESEEHQFISLLNILSRVFIPEEGEDSREYKASLDGSFCVFFLLGCVKELHL